MSKLSEEIRTAIQAARQAPDNNDPFKGVLDQIAEGISDEDVKAEVHSGGGPSWTLSLAPAYQPGRATAVLQVVRTTGGVYLLNDPKQGADSPDHLTYILKRFVTDVAFISNLEQIAALSRQPIEGFLRVFPGTVSRHDLMVVVPPEIQRREIAEKVGQAVTLALNVADFPGAGTFKAGVAYKTTESAGLVVTLTHPVEQSTDLSLTFRGIVGMKSEHPIRTLLDEPADRLTLADARSTLEAIRRTCHKEFDDVPHDGIDALARCYRLASEALGYARDGDWEDYDVEAASLAGR